MISTLLALATTLLVAGPPSAAPDSPGSSGKVDFAATAPASSVRADFAGQARSAGLTAKQSASLQGKANAYLAKLGKGATQKSFNTIALKGADLYLTVPGEAQPRGLAASYCAYYYFCAYSGERQTGDSIHMYDCGVYNYIPWVTMGSWVNNQTRGTRPWLYFWTDGSWWNMPAAYAQQLTGVGWSPVDGIIPC
ncbi:hypothetical protein ACQPZX_12570 [Actinoplanes sp. CA-142083]|uniref:hypothetical protein n=1 Tax=Actinoplanes sp. CA-142083 TaxID=3239903 RepID=UPI003D8E7D49